MREAVETGLAKVDALEVGRGFAELTAGARGEGGAVVGFARGEVGWRPASSVSLFGFGEATVSGASLSTMKPAWQAGLGARVAW